VELQETKILLKKDQILYLVEAELLQLQLLGGVVVAHTMGETHKQVDQAVAVNITPRVRQAHRVKEMQVELITVVLERLAVVVQVRQVEL
jgi:hypothetical protein